MCARIQDTDGEHTLSNEQQATTPCPPAYHNWELRKIPWSYHMKDDGAARLPTVKFCGSNYTTDIFSFWLYSLIWLILFLQYCEVPPEVMWRLLSFSTCWMIVSKDWGIWGYCLHSITKIKVMVNNL